MNNESRILLGLLSRGVPTHIAQGMVANMIAESRLDPGINEIAPIVPGSRGGFGLNQWTGPRRRELEAEAQRRGVPVSDLDFQLDFTLQELQGPEARAWNALQGATTAEEAARIYSDRFLRPGIPHMDRRLAEARRLSGQPMPSGAPSDAPSGTRQQGNAQQPTTERERMVNALAMRDMMMRDTRQDPAAFMTRPMQQNALAPAEFRPRYLTRT